VRAEVEIAVAVAAARDVGLVLPNWDHRNVGVWPAEDAAVACDVRDAAVAEMVDVVNERNKVVGAELHMLEVGVVRQSEGRIAGDIRRLVDMDCNQAGPQAAAVAEQRAADGDTVVVAVAVAFAIENHSHNSHIVRFVQAGAVEVAAARSIGGYMPGLDVPARETAVDAGRQRQRPSTRSNPAEPVGEEEDQVVREAVEAYKWAGERKDSCSFFRVLVLNDAIQHRQA
jgi:hypothetical protein